MSKSKVHGLSVCVIVSDLGWPLKVTSATKKQRRSNIILMCMSDMLQWLSHAWTTVDAPLKMFAIVAAAS